MKEYFRPLYYRIIKLLRWIAAPIVTSVNKHRFFSNRVLSVDSFKRIISERPSYAIGADYNDLIFLYKAVRKRKPEVVLEFGSGWSTYVIGSALAANAMQGVGGFLFSIDHVEEWANVTSDTMPSNLLKYVNVLYSPINEKEYDGVKGWVYSKVPDIIPNMVFLDGPCLTEERCAALDLLYMEDRFPEDFYLIIDKRHRNAAILKEKFKNKYLYKEHRGPFKGVYYINTFKKVLD